MQCARLSLFAFALVFALALVPARGAGLRVRRQLADDDALQPLQEEGGAGEGEAREKRKLEGVTQAKFGIKNAVLGFVFGNGITLSRHRRASGDTSSNTSTNTDPSTSPSTSLSTSAGTDAGTRSGRQVKKQDDIPEFDRNKVSLDFPGNLFGPSVSLLIRTTKIVGDVIQNSAVRYQTFLRLFRPLFRGPFEIKGLDPPTTTTTTTTTTTQPPSTKDNEVRRRRHLKL